MPRSPHLLGTGALLGSLLLLAGCGGNGLNLGSLGGGGGNGDQVRYRCDNDRTLRVHYSDNGQRATVETGSETYRLRLTDRNGRQRTYGEDGTQLLVDGHDARFRLKNDRDFTGCEER
ncbi:MAG: hypothetical protein U1E17_21535 [Geminicoccaceae bacterium]